MKPYSENAAKKLLSDDVNLAVVNGEEQYTFCERGISALVRVLHCQPQILQGACVADKIVGKAAALLFVYGEVKRAFAKTVSAGAIAVFERFGVPFEFEVKTDKIINRKGTGICPMEEVVAEISEPKEAFEALSEAVKRLGGR